MLYRSLFENAIINICIYLWVGISTAGKRGIRDGTSYGTFEQNSVESVFSARKHRVMFVNLAVGIEECCVDVVRLFTFLEGRNTLNHIHSQSDKAEGLNFTTG